jgi:nucleoside-diphosphate-sugar epimerase
VEVAIARASDFFGPCITQAVTFGTRFFERVLAGKSAECFGDPDQPHAYTYMPDVADALVTLGHRPEAVGHVWHVPTHAAETTRQMIARMAHALDLPVKISRVPTWLIRTMGIVSPIMREIAEMTYQWEIPYVVDDSAFRKVFGAAPTPLNEAMATTARWALATHGGRIAA